MYKQNNMAQQSKFVTKEAIFY